MSSGSKEKEPRYVWLSEAKVSHSQRMWAKVSFSAPCLLRSGRSSRPSRWRCLLRVLCPVRRPVTAPDLVLLKDRNLVLAPRQGREISSRTCLWVSPKPRHFTRCWLTNRRLILFRISRLETPRAGSGPRNPRREPLLASSSAISLPRTPDSCVVYLRLSVAQNLGLCSVSGRIVCKKFSCGFWKQAILD